MDKLPNNLKLMADYDCWCLWDMDIIENIDPETLPISKNLKQKLQKWEIDYNATLVRDNPIESGFKTDDDFKNFVDIGWRLFEQLCAELPNINFYYFDKSTAKLNSDTNTV